MTLKHNVLCFASLTCFRLDFCSKKCRMVICLWWLLLYVNVWWWHFPITGFVTTSLRYLTSSYVLICLSDPLGNKQNLKTNSTHVKISQLVASLQTSRQQVVFARLVTSCQQVWNKLLTTCNNLVDIIRLFTRLFQHGCYNHDITILLQPCVVNLVTFLIVISWLYQTC